ncbi:MAG TPA: hypothetical protein VN764_04805, partial [Polyangiaceae bacterium]|nr:hypothetical protein [Polyangiaceae bacterium]
WQGQLGWIQNLSAKSRGVGIHIQGGWEDEKQYERIAAQVVEVFERFYALLRPVALAAKQKVVG